MLSFRLPGINLEMLSPVLRDKSSRWIDLGKQMSERDTPVTEAKGNSGSSVGFLLESDAALRLMSLHNTSFGNQCPGAAPGIGQNTVHISNMTI